MSTKISIRSGNGPSGDFHLFHEAFEPDHVYLELRDIEFIASSSSEAGNNLQVRMPMELAKALNLVPAEYESGLVPQRRR